MGRREALPALVALAAILAWNGLMTPGFLSFEARDGRVYGSVIDVLDRAAPVLVVALGQALVIATGGVDLSVGAVMAVSGSLAATLLAGGTGAFGAIGASLLASLFLGTWNGLLVTRLSLPPIVATLTLMVAGRGIAQLLSNGQIVTIDDAAFAELGGGAVFVLPAPAVIGLALLAATAALARLTAFSLFVEATGANEAACRAAGVPVARVKVAAYAASGLLAGAAGLLVASDIRAADANNAGLAIELDAILAVVIGGTSLSGGRFSLLGAALGAIALQALSTTILTMGVAVEHTLVVKAVVVLAVALLHSDRLGRILARPRGSLR